MTVNELCQITEWIIGDVKNVCESSANLNRPLSYAAETELRKRIVATLREELNAT